MFWVRKRQDYSNASNAFKTKNWWSGNYKISSIIFNYISGYQYVLHVIFLFFFSRQGLAISIWQIWSRLSTLWGCHAYSPSDQPISALQPSPAPCEASLGIKRGCKSAVSHLFVLSSYSDLLTSYSPALNTSSRCLPFSTSSTVARTSKSLNSERFTWRLATFDRNWRRSWGSQSGKSEPRRGEMRRFWSSGTAIPTKVCLFDIFYLLHDVYTCIKTHLCAVIDGWMHCSLIEVHV